MEAKILLRNFMMERIAVSYYKDRFILKSGMLITSVVGIDTRTTMYMDVTIKGQKRTDLEIKAIIQDVLKIQIDDGAVLSFQGIEEVRKKADYPGFRVLI